MWVLLLLIFGIFINSTAVVDSKQIISKYHHTDSGAIRCNDQKEKNCEPQEKTRKRETEEWMHPKNCESSFSIHYS